MAVRSFPTVLDAFMASLAEKPDALALRVVERSDLPAVEITYREFYDLACRAKAGFQEHGLEAGDRIILALPTSKEFYALYLGAVFCGVIPMAEAAPRPTGGAPGAEERLDSFRRRSGARVTVVQAEAREALSPGAVAGTLTPEDLLDHGGSEPVELTATPADVAHLQATSGSTGEQKMAIVRHGNIAANIHAIGTLLEQTPEDSVMLWLPMFHDMGLIGTLCSFYWQVPMTVTDPANFVRHPIRYWPEIMSRYGITITAAPNSAYQACARLALRRRFKNIELSRLRATFWGAEPIHKETLDSFHRAFEPYGYRPEGTLAVYGLAESTLASTIPSLRDLPKVDRVGAEMRQEGESWGLDLGEGGREMELVCVGSAIEGHAVRVVDGKRRPLPEGRVGEIEFRGPSVISGYWGEDGHRPEREDPWLVTGDLGYLKHGELYIVGRKKELIIVSGRNIIPAEVEVFAEKLVDNGIQKGVAAVGIEDPHSLTEHVHLVIEARVLPVPDQAPLEEKIRTAMAEEFGLPGVGIHWVAKGAIPKTTSGKIQRFLCRAMARG